MKPSARANWQKRLEHWESYDVSHEAARLVLLWPELVALPARRLKKKLEAFLQEAFEAGRHQGASNPYA